MSKMRKFSIDVGAEGGDMTAITVLIPPGESAEKVHRLIAAAPEMYELLHFIEENGYDKVKYKTLINLLKKVEGEQ